MGFNRRKMEDKRREAVEKEAAGRRATDVQVLEDAERLIAVWNERQAKRMPMLFSPTIGAAITAAETQRNLFLWARYGHFAESLLLPDLLPNFLRRYSHRSI